MANRLCKLASSTAPAIASLLVLGTGATAQSAQTVIVVDKQGKGDFTELATAVANAADGAVIRVKYYNAYLPFFFSNKSLTIIGEKDASTGKFPVVMVPKINNQYNRLVIGPLAATNRVILKNITLRTNDYVIGAPIEVTGVAGAMVFDNVEFTGGLYSYFRVEVLGSRYVYFQGCKFGGQSPANKSNYVLKADRSWVSLAHCRIDGLSARTGATLPGSAGLLAVASRVVAVETTITGGQGASAIYNGTGGGPAIELQNGSNLLFLGSQPGLLTGGRGGCGGLGSGGNGGAGVVLSGGSRAQFEGTAPVGGTACNNGGKAGPAILQDSSSTVIQNSGSQPAIANATGLPVAGGTVTYTLAAVPGSAALMFVGLTPRFTDLRPAVLGVLLVSPDLPLGAFSLPASGTLQIPIPLPKKLAPGLTSYVQFASQKDNGTLWASNPVILTSQ